MSHLDRDSHLAEPTRLRSRRDVALTFDDGPSSYTRQVLRVLTRLHAPATFFVIGRLARAYPRLIAAEARSDFEIGDHTETHAPACAGGASGSSPWPSSSPTIHRPPGSPHPSRCPAGAERSLP